MLPVVYYDNFITLGADRHGYEAKAKAKILAILEEKAKVAASHISHWSMLTHMYTIGY